ncbi:acetyl-CoA carboxylase biotin carboxyl carrier protein subunit [Actinomadura rugatobispora]|uniref:Acetyl-CoA carboxylase biotin carboxyl carrier protein subunit n=1 Tax=Actinomadura rugatobispora TaxID=1994 RepID=A0ABW0ZUD1_9ACTN
MEPAKRPLRPGRRHADRDPVPPRGRVRPGVRRCIQPVRRRLARACTQWIETEFDNRIEPYAGEHAEAGSADLGQASGSPSSSSAATERGRRGRARAARGRAPRQARRSPASGAKRLRRAGRKKAGAAAGGDAGTIVKIVEEGQDVAEDDAVVVIEAMKTEQPLKVHETGTVTDLQAEVGRTVANRADICELEEATR